MATAKTKAHKVGDTVQLAKDSSRFVALPDGSVVSTYMVYTFTTPGKHTIDGVEYDVVDPAAPADKADKADES